VPHVQQSAVAKARSSPMYAASKAGKQSKQFLSFPGFVV
jgi:hypothetical protein